MLFTVVVTFFACMLPFKVLSLWVVLLPTDFDQYINPEAYFNLLYFARIMYYTNSAINPILYNIMSSKFRFEKLISTFYNQSTNILRIFFIALKSLL